jgi:hypothetical protein
MRDAGRKMDEIRKLIWRSLYQSRWPKVSGEEIKEACIAWK